MAAERKSTTRKDAEDLAAEEPRIVEHGSIEEIVQFYDHNGTAELPWEKDSDTVIERPDLDSTPPTH